MVAVMMVMCVAETHRHFSKAYLKQLTGRKCRQLPDPNFQNPSTKLFGSWELEIGR
jgi:hypothetical protein